MLHFLIDRNNSMCFVFLISHRILGSDKPHHLLPPRICEPERGVELFLPLIFHPMPSDSGEMKKTAANYSTLAKGKKIPTCSVFLAFCASNHGCWLVCPFLGCLPEWAVLITAVFGSAEAAPALSKVCFVFWGFGYLLMVGKTVLTVVCCLRKCEGKGKMLKCPDCRLCNVLGYFWFLLGDSAHNLTSITFCKILCVS